MKTKRVAGSNRNLAGFTLIEAVIVIVITGILVAIVAVFITGPVQGYADSVRRAELTDAADVALRRLTRDIRLALPNSLRTGASAGVNYIEFIMTSAGGRYRDPADGSTGGDFLSFTDIADTTFDVLGASAVLGTSGVVAANDYIVVYNLGDGYGPANAYDVSAVSGVGTNIARISSVSASTITMVSNPFGAQSPPLPSPNSRFQVVPGSVQAVTFSCPATGMGALNRYAGYGINVAMGMPPSGTPAVLATNASCAVTYNSTASARDGLVSITLTLTDPTSGESVSLMREIHVDNSP